MTGAPEPVRCPECVAAGQRSFVTEHGGTVTCMYFAPFYDEDGRRHHHDGNARSMNYTCSAGHRWATTTSGTCWCGWGKVPTWAPPTSRASSPSGKRSSRERGPSRSTAATSSAVTTTSTTKAAFATLRAELDRLTVENERLRDVLHDIAGASASMAEQCPYWAREAICEHETREINKRGELACVACWHVEEKE